MLELSLYIFYNKELALSTVFRQCHNITFVNILDNIFIVIMKSNRLHHIHYLRGIAALLVFWNHFGLPPYQYLSCTWIAMNSIFRASAIWLTNNNHIISIEMSRVFLFFLISGFIIPLSLENVKTRTFIKRRIFRIYPVYIFGLSFFILYNILFCNPSFTLSELCKKLAGSLFFLNDFILSDPRNDIENIMGVSWTLTIEVEFYVMTLLCLYFVKIFLKKQDCISPLITFIMICISAIIFCLSKKSNFVSGGGMLIILIGMSFYNIKKSILNNNKNDLKFSIINLILILLILWYFLSFKKTFVHWHRNLLTSVLMYQCFAFIFRTKTSKILDFFGNISYPLYVIHLPISTMFFMYFNNIFSKQLLIVLGVSFTIFISYILHRFVEKPMIAFSKSNKY